MGARVSKSNFNCNCLVCDNLESKKFGKYQEFLENYNFYTQNNILLDYTNCLCSCNNSIKRFRTSTSVQKIITLKKN